MTKVAALALASSMLLACSGDGGQPVQVTVQETNVQFACLDEQVGRTETVTRDCGGVRYVYFCSADELCDAEIAALLAPIVACEEMRLEYEVDPSTELCGDPE